MVSTLTLSPFAEALPGGPWGPGTPILPCEERAGEGTLRYLGCRRQAWGGTHREAGGARRPGLSFQALGKVIMSPLLLTSPCPTEPHNPFSTPIGATHHLSGFPLLALGKDKSGEGQSSMPQEWPSLILSTLNTHLWTIH